MSDTGDATRAFVLGFDGVPWSLVQRWAAAGHLPSFETIIEEGAAGPMQSTVPASTPLAWPAIATGVGADRHGIYGFQRLDGEYTKRMYTSADRRHPALWDLVSPAVVGNVPMTYPADEIDGAMVTGMMTPEMDEDFAHPSSLAEEIETEVPAYRIGLDWSSYGGQTDEFLDEITSLVEARRAVMRRLLEEPWRLAFFVYTAPDRLQHLVWDEDVLLEHYKHLDDVLGEVMSAVAERDATLYVMSDHGFGPISRFVHVNRVLEREGFLARREAEGTRKALADIGVTKDSVLGALQRLGIDDDTVARLFPEFITKSVAARVPGDHALYDVDFPNTKAFVHGPGNLYVNDTERFEDGTVPPSEVDGVKRDVAAALRSVADPDTGDRPLEVRDGNELFPDDPESPDLVVTGTDSYEVEKSLADRVFVDPGVKAAGHRSEGILLAWGANVDGGAELSGASVYDVAPTVLHGLGEPVPETATGDVLRDVFSPGSQPARRAVAKREVATHGAAGGRSDAPDEDYSDVEDRLRGLGYLE